MTLKYGVLFRESTSLLNEVLFFKGFFLAAKNIVPFKSACQIGSYSAEEYFSRLVSRWSCKYGAVGLLRGHFGVMSNQAKQKKEVIWYLYFPT